MIKINVNEMKAGLAGAVALVVLAAGCRSAVDAQGQISTPKYTASGGISTTTNAVKVSGDFQTGTTNVGGSVTIQK